MLMKSVCNRNGKLAMTRSLADSFIKLSQISMSIKERIINYIHVQEQRLKRRNTLGGLEMSIRRK